MHARHDNGLDNETELIRRAKAGDRSATAELIDQYLYLLIWLVGKTRYRHTHDGDDLRQEAVIGFMRAIQKFKPDGGRRFSAFVVLVVQRRLWKSVGENRLVRVPNSSRYLSRACGGRSRKLRADVTADIERAGKPVYQIRDDALSCSDHQPLDDADELDWLRRQLDTLHTLTDRERNILRRRIAGATFIEIAREQGCCKQRVSQFERQAVAKLKSAAKV